MNAALIESICVISAAVKINEYDSNNAYEISSDLNSNDSMMAEECAWVLGMVGGLVHVALAPWVPSGISCLGSSYWGIHLRGDNTSHFSMLSVAFGIGRLVSHSRSRSSHVRFNSSVSRAKSAAVHTHSRVARVPGCTWAQMTLSFYRWDLIRPSHPELDLDQPSNTISCISHGKNLGHLISSFLTPTPSDQLSLKYIMKFPRGRHMANMVKSSVIPVHPHHLRSPAHYRTASGKG